MPTTSTLAQLAPAVGARLQDPSYVFWQYQYEVLAGLEEAVSELLLIIGRPTVIYNAPLQLTPNTCFQPMPAGVLCLTDLRTITTRLWKTTLHALDYTTTSWTSSWESDRAAVPARWAALGLNYFIVHPAPLQPITVNITGIAYPFLDGWPPSGEELSPFHKEIDQALQLYAASYTRMKEIGNDAMEGFSLYQAFLEIGQRLSLIEDRRDSLIWTRSIGAPTAPSQVSHR